MTFGIEFNTDLFERSRIRHMAICLEALASSSSQAYSSHAAWSLAVPSPQACSHQAVWLKEEGSTVPPGVTRAINRQEYNQLEAFSRTRPADLWVPRATSTIHWHNADHSAWLSQTNECWEGWEDASGAPCSLSLEWQPWDALFDDVSGRGSNLNQANTHAISRLLGCIAAGCLALRSMVCRRPHQRSLQRARPSRAHRPRR